MDEIDELLKKRIEEESLNEKEALNLIMASTLGNVAEEIIETAAKLKRPHKDKVFALPPLYITNKCENKCVYCPDFREDGEKLSLEEFKSEFQALLDKGYSSIELVFGQDPDLFVHNEDFELKNQKYDITDVLEYVKAARSMLDSRGGGLLTINSPPVDIESYKKLKKAGIDVMLLWAETFNPIQYVTLHPGNTPKIDQRFRLESYERARKSGIEHIAGTYLKELYDWRVEKALLYNLEKRLKENFGKGFSIIGTPRYKGRDLEPLKDYKMSEEEYILDIALDLILYEGVIWLQSREKWELNKKIIDKFGGGFILTLDCSTAPGGYAEEAKGKEQFSVQPHTPEIITPSLEEKGIKIIYNWNLEHLKEMQRT